MGGVAVQCGEAIGRAVHALEAGIVAVQVVVPVFVAPIQYPGTAGKCVHPAKAIAGCCFVADAVSIYFSDEGCRDVSPTGAAGCSGFKEPVECFGRFLWVVQYCRRCGHGGLGHAFVAADAPVSTGAYEFSEESAFDVFADVGDARFGVFDLPFFRLCG